MLTRRRALILLGVVLALVLLTVVSVSVLPSVPGLGRRFPSGPTAVPTQGYTAITTDSALLFDLDSASLSPEATPVLQTVVTRIRAGRPNGIVRVEGYTDDDGSDGYNDALSRRRAEAVASWLADAGGIDPSRIQVVAYGETDPAVPNDTPEHKQANRRVVVRVQQ